MTPAEITAAQHSRKAAIYIRQSTLTQVAENLESQRRQYGLVERAAELGWRRSDILVIDDDLGVSGSGIARTGFDRLVAEVGWATLAPSLPSRSRVWLATTVTGTTCSTCAPWSTPSLAIP